MSRHRFDADAYEAAWPDLVDVVPADEDLVDRDAVLQFHLSRSDQLLLGSLSNLLGCSPAGLALKVLFEFTYGYYLLERMRREGDGLFTGKAGHDPAPGSSFRPDEAGSIRLAMPRRLLMDLGALAHQGGEDTEALAARTLRRYMHGHLDPDA